MRVHFSFRYITMAIACYNCHSQLSLGDLYLDIRIPNSSLILRKISNIPLKSYEYSFDTVAGRRQMGFFGSEVMSAFPESVEVAAKHTLPNRDRAKPPTVLFDYPLVDKSVIFMHSIVAIQELQRIFATLYKVVTSCQLEWLNLFEAIKTINSTTGGNSNWLSLSSIRILDEISQLQKKAVEVLINRTASSSKTRIDYSNRRKILSDEIHLRHHYRLGNASIDATSNLENIFEIKVESLSDLKYSALFKKQESDLSQLDADYTESIQKYISEIDHASSLVNFKISSLYGLQNEERDLNAMKSKDEIMRGEVNYLIQVFFLELSQILLMVSMSPTLLFMRGAAILIFLVFALLIYECTMIFKVWLWHKLCSPTELQAQRICDPRSSSRGARNKHELESYDLVFVPHTMNQLTIYSITLTNSTLNNLPLPNLLLLGHSGTGRTCTAHALATSSGASVLKVSGAQLLSQGGGAGTSFRALLGTTRHRQGRVIVILDDADSIILARGKEGGSTPSVHCCLYLLLEAIRESREELSVIITSTLDLPSIDSALLDRLDEVIHLPLPGAEERLTFAAQRTLELLSPFLDKDSKGALSNMAPTPARAVGRPGLCQQRTLFRDSLERPVRDKEMGGGRSSLVCAPSAAEVAFDVQQCLTEMVARTQSCTLRDLETLLSIIRSEALGTDSCMLTNELWMKELNRAGKDSAATLAYRGCSAPNFR